MYVVIYIDYFSVPVIVGSAEVRNASVVVVAEVRSIIVAAHISGSVCKATLSSPVRIKEYG